MVNYIHSRASMGKKFRIFRKKCKIIIRKYLYNYHGGFVVNYIQKIRTVRVE